MRDLALLILNAGGGSGEAERAYDNIFIAKDGRRDASCAQFGFFRVQAVPLLPDF